VVVFARKHIDAILSNLVDPGGFFDEELRTVYDYVFERRQEQ
jgi:hypothetical protein